MKKRTFSYLLLFILLFHGKTKAQKDSIRINSIPYGMFWENKAEKFSANNNELVMVAGEKTDMFRDPNGTDNTDNALRLLFRPDNDFVLITAIEHSFASKWDAGAIVLKKDSLNWIKFCFEKDYTGAKRVVSVVTKNISDDCNSVEVKANKVFYKLAKADNVITLYYSLEGKKWFLIRHLRFDSDEHLTLGFLAQSPTGKKCEVKFSNISYQAKKIKDPYVGE